MQRQGKRGQSLIEFVLILPVLIVILVVLADLSRSIAAHVALSNAAREGVRFGALHPNDAVGIRNRVLLEYNNSGLRFTGMELRFEDIQVSFPDGSATKGNLIRVETNCHFPLAFGSFFPAALVDENGAITLTGSAEMVIM